MSQVKIIEGDITQLEVDAIVNAANRSLMGGGGVDGAIHRAAGPDLLEECKKIRSEQLPQGLPTGQALITKGYDLPAKHVIHTVGPVWHGGDNEEDALLEDCYKNSLKLARIKELSSIAFPAISTGVYNFPPKRACHIAFQSVQDFIKRQDEINEVVFAVIGENIDIYKNNYSKYF